MENIPHGLYNVILENIQAEGLLSDWKLSKYDNGVTTEQTFSGDFGMREKILLSIGKFEFQSTFLESLQNQSSLYITQYRRHRRGGKPLVTSGSHQLSSGGGRRGMGPS